MIIGLDTNIICYALDKTYPEHQKLADLFLGLSPENKVALNPTTFHETYQTLVFGQKWVPEDASKTLRMLLKHPFIEFFNQTRLTCTISLSLSIQHKLDGRDALIIANFLANSIPAIYTHDKELLKLKEITWRTRKIDFKDPLTAK
jgi:predicted nucleic acid-binding protein